LEGERTVWREKGQFGGRKDSLGGERTVSANPEFAQKLERTLKTLKQGVSEPSISSTTAGGGRANK
jgi:hypothetical protein